MNKLAVLLLAFTLFGCEGNSVVFTEESRQRVKKLNEKKGLARVALFKECMELAAKMPRQEDDDVAYIVQK